MSGIVDIAGVEASASGGGGTPGGSNTQVQFNNAGAFGGSANLTYNGSTLESFTRQTDPAPTSNFAEAVLGVQASSFTASNTTVASVGVEAQALVGASNTADWTKAGYPLLVGLYATAGSTSAASGTIDRAAAIWSFINQPSTGATLNVATALWLDWSGPYRINYAVGAMIMNTTHGTNNTGIFMDLDQTATPPSGNWSIYDNNGYSSWLRGGLALGGTAGAVSDPGTGNLAITGAVTAGAWHGTPITPAYIAGGWHTLKQINTEQTVVTGTTAKTTSYSLTVPGGTITANGRFRVSVMYRFTGSGGTRSFGVDYGGTTFFNLTGVGATALSVRPMPMEIANRSATNSQIAITVPSVNGTGGATLDNVTGSVDTTADQTLSLWIQLTSGSDSGAVESVLIEYNNDNP